MRSIIPFHTCANTPTPHSERYNSIRIPGRREGEAGATGQRRAATNWHCMEYKESLVLAIVGATRSQCNSTLIIYVPAAQWCAGWCARYFQLSYTAPDTQVISLPAHIYARGGPCEHTSTDWKGSLLMR